LPNAKEAPEWKAQQILSVYWSTAYNWRGVEPAPGYFGQHVRPNTLY
jgi:hypothetical protein